MMMKEGKGKGQRVSGLVIALRVILGGLFVWAGVLKLMSLDEFVQKVGYFEIWPFDHKPWDMWLGYTLPGFEVIAGSCLILGILYRGALVSITVLSLGFLVAIYSVYVRGLNIECGCFGKALKFGNYYIHMAVLGVMVLMCLVLIYKECQRDRVGEGRVVEGRAVE